jgi:arsenate reductase
MAHAFMEEHGAGLFTAFSAGSQPADALHTEVLEAMKMRGIDLTDRRPVDIKDLPSQSFDLVVTIGCNDACPSVQAVKRLDWDLDDPSGQKLQEVIRIRDQIEDKVVELLQSLEGGK